LRTLTSSFNFYLRLHCPGETTKRKPAKQTTDR
jgi:hypothetical protein